MAVAFTVFLGDLVPLGSSWWTVRSSSGSVVIIDFGARQLIAVLLIGLLATLNVRGVAKAGRFQSWVKTLKVLGVVGLIVVIMVLAQRSTPAASIVSTPVADTAGPSAFAAAMLALVIAIGAATLIYLAVNLAYLHALTMDEIGTANSTAHPHASSVASRAAAAALGPRATTLLTLLLLVCAYEIAEVFAWRGDKERAFEWLDGAYKQRGGGLSLIKTDPLLKSLR